MEEYSEYLMKTINIIIDNVLVRNGIKYTPLRIEDDNMFELTTLTYMDTFIQSEICEKINNILNNSGWEITHFNAVENEYNYIIHNYYINFEEEAKIYNRKLNLKALVEE